MNKALLPALIILNFLNLLDVILTRYGLALANTQELNPFYQPTLISEIVKLGSIGIFSMLNLVTFHYAEKENNKHAQIFILAVVFFAVIFYVFVVTNNTIVILRSMEL